jgi:hypothetical protein
MAMRSAVLWMTHVWNKELESEFERILNINYPGSPDVWLILDAKTPGAKDIARHYERCHLFTLKEMFQRLPYPRLSEETLYSQSHFPVLDFYLSHREYDRYWVIEFDVRYTGEWGSFLKSFETFDHDLITSHIRHISEEPDWYWWNSFVHPTKTIDRSRYVRSVNVIYRMSNRALSLIHDAQQDGWRGHPEVLIPTLLDNSDYSVLDFGGDSKFTLPGFKNRYYTSISTRDGVPGPFCTYRWKPSRTRAGIRRNKIYHPVKPGSMQEPLRERVVFFIQWSWKYICEIQKTTRLK